MKLARELLKNPRYPRTAKYDPEWLVGLDMGCPTFWLLETLCEAMDLRPGMRIMDLGCGKAGGSIFLAKEYGLQVWAVDPAVKPTENWRRIQEVGLEDRVFPLNADGTRLPFAEGFFDAIIATNSLWYFASEDLYLRYRLVNLVKPDGQFGIVLPGFYKDFEGDLPEALPEHLSPTGPPAHCVPGIPPNGGGVTGTRPSKWISSWQIISSTMKATRLTCAGSGSSSILKNSPRAIRIGTSPSSAWWHGVKILDRKERPEAAPG
jgi:SAM-dependent methyltransferase